MNFDALNKQIPWVTGEIKHVVTMSPYPNVSLLMPGRHQNDTDPAGGDACVIVTDQNIGWIDHQFTHADLFLDIEKKRREDKVMAVDLLSAYHDVVNGADPENFRAEFNDEFVNSLDGATFLYAVQCLAVIEHRRYKKFESKGGGRFLPYRFSAGIVEGLWTAADAAHVQRKGRPGVEMLERFYGKPVLVG